MATEQLISDIANKEKHWKGKSLRKLQAIKQFIEANPEVPFYKVYGNRSGVYANSPATEVDIAPAQPHLGLGPVQVGTHPGVHIEAITHRGQPLIRIRLADKDMVVEPTAHIPDLHERSQSPWILEKGVSAYVEEQRAKHEEQGF